MQCRYGWLIGCGEKKNNIGPLKFAYVMPMRLNMAQMAQEVFAEPLELSIAAGCETPKVLVVDDDEQFRILARAILEPGGYEVIEANSALDCMVQLRCQAVDAVILDMVMPGLDGIEALREVKKRFPEIRIVTVSGADQSDLYLSVSAHLGADASLEKANIGTLCPLLQVVLDR